MSISNNSKYIAVAYKTEKMPVVSIYESKEKQEKFKHLK